jgi:CDP-diacylglycerol--serine O-phosphatidyltransferase
MKDWCDLPILIMFPLCAVIRLAYFNVAEEERQKKTTENRKMYEGLPVTSVALILPLLYSFHKDIGEWFPEVYGGALLLIALAFITRFKVKKPSMKTMLCFIGVGVIELIWMLYKTKTR